LFADAGLLTPQLSVEVPVQPVILQAFAQWLAKGGQFPSVESARTRQSFLEITQVLRPNGYCILNWLDKDFPDEQPAEEPVAPPAEAEEDEGKR
jgi:hypothetical protein